MAKYGLTLFQNTRKNPSNEKETILSTFSFKILCIEWIKIVKSRNREKLTKWNEIKTLNVLKLQLKYQLIIRMLVC